MAKKKKAWHKDMHRDPKTWVAAVALGSSLWSTFKDNQHSKWEHQVQLDTAVAVSYRVKAIEPELGFMLKSYQERHPDLWDNFNSRNQK